MCINDFHNFETIINTRSLVWIIKLLQNWGYVIFSSLGFAQARSQAEDLTLRL